MRSPSPLVDRILCHAEREPTGCAVASRTVLWTYAELSERVLDHASTLGRTGVDRSSVLGIACADDIEHLLLCLAAAHLGATTLTVPTFEPAQQRRRLMEKAGVQRVVGGPDVWEDVHVPGERDASPVPGAPAGPKFLFATSGTTGEPKVVCHLDAGLVDQAPRHVGAKERFACLATMEHNFAKRHRLYCASQGATNVFLDAALPTLVEACKDLELTTLHLTAFQAQELLAAPGVGDLRSLRLKLGGSHVPSALREELRACVTSSLQCGYGTTETGAISFTEASDHGPGESVGTALPGIEIKVADAEGAKATPGERGEVQIRCKGMFLGYVGDPERTAQRLHGEWFHTGDIGHLDADGRLHLGGRSDDMFVFNTINIYPQELEAQIRQHPSVLDAAVVPHASPVHGDVPVALVVAGGGASLDMRALKAFVRERTGVRCPRRFTVVDQIPRNESGKILRAKALALLEPPTAR